MKKSFTSFYMRFSKIRKNSILPLIIDESDVPLLLSSIKYFRLTNGGSYKTYLGQLAKALKKHENK